MKRDLPKLPDELDERLREWARYFKDRHHWERARSLEGRFNRFMPGARDESWGDPGPPEAILPEVKLPRVLLTHAIVMGLPSKTDRWSITFSYCYPSMERWQTLKYLRKYTGQRYSWTRYLEALEIARMRVWAGILNQCTAQALDRTEPLTPISSL